MAASSSACAFYEQVWDLELKGGAEVGVDLIKKYSSEIDYFGESPRTEVALCALQGKVQVTINGHHQRKLDGPPGPALLQWDSSNEEPPVALPVQVVPPFWNRASPMIVLNKYIKELTEAFTKAKQEEAARIRPYLDYYQRQRDNTKLSLIALGELSGMLNDKKPLELVIEELRLEKMKPEYRQIALLAFSALGQVDKLMEALTDEDPEHYIDRDNAVFALRRYLSHSLESGWALYRDDGKKKTGLLVEKYGEKEGLTIFTLLHDFSPRDLKPETFDLLARICCGATKWRYGSWRSGISTSFRCG